MTETGFSRIVVGINGSLQSLVALRWALLEAVTTGGVVEVVHCWQPYATDDGLFGSSDDVHRGSLRMLHSEIRAALAAMPGSVPLPQVRVASCPGRAPDVLLDRAAGARMLVLGARGRTQVRDFGFGRVAASCLRRAEMPVVIVENERTVIRHERTVPVPGTDLSGMAMPGEQ